MGEPDEVWQERLKLLEPYRVNKELMDKTGNPNVILNIVYLHSTILTLKSVNRFMNNTA